MTGEKHTSQKPKIERQSAIHFEREAARRRIVNHRDRVRKRFLKFSTGFSCCSTLMGQHGEQTNTDDLKIEVDGAVVVPKKGKPGRKQKKSNQQQQVVVVAPKLKGNKKSRRKQRAMIPRYLGGGSWSDPASRAFLAAMIDPFNPIARGAKCLVYPARNTIGYTISWSATITPPSVSHMSAFIFIPNPAVFGWGAVTTATPATVNTIDGKMNQVVGSSTVGLNGALVDATDNSTTGVPSLGKFLSNYRVVGGGIRLRGTAPTSSVQQMSILTSLPLQNPDWIYDQVTGSNGTVSEYSNTTANYWDQGSGQRFVEQSLFGADVNGNVSLSALPTTKKFTNYEIMQKEIVAHFKVVGPDAFEFKDLSNNSPSLTNNATHVVYNADNVLIDNNGGTLTNQYFRRGTTDVAGFDGLYLKVQGIASYSPIVMDYILHVEGVPLAVTGMGNLGAAMTSNADWSVSKTIDQVISVASAVPSITAQTIGIAGQLGHLATTLGQTALLVNGQFNRGLRGSRRRIEF